MVRRAFCYMDTPHTIVRDDTVVEFFTDTAAGTLAADSQQRLWLGVGESLLVVDPATGLMMPMTTSPMNIVKWLACTLIRSTKLSLTPPDRAWIAQWQLFARRGDRLVRG